MDPRAEGRESKAWGVQFEKASSVIQIQARSNTGSQSETSKQGLGKRQRDEVRKLAWSPVLTSHTSRLNEEISWFIYGYTAQEGLMFKREGKKLSFIHDKFENYLWLK